MLTRGTQQYNPQWWRQLATDKIDALVDLLKKEGVWHQLYDRRHLMVLPEKERTPPVGGFEFSLMQFNLLADGLSGAPFGTPDKPDPKGFPKCPLPALPWRYRGTKILEEIHRFKPAVVAMEEVDQFEFLLHFLRPVGYEGKHKAKRGSKTPKMAGKLYPGYGVTLPPDGTAIFWDTRVFRKTADVVFGGELDVA